MTPASSLNLDLNGYKEKVLVFEANRRHCVASAPSLIIVKECFGHFGTLYFLSEIIVSLNIIISDITEDVDNTANEPFKSRREYSVISGFHIPRCFIYLPKGRSYFLRG